VPEGRWEWTTFVVGAIVSAALLVLIVIHAPSHAVGSAPKPTTATPPPAARRPQTTTVERPSAATTTATQSPGNPGRPLVVIRLTARDDTWLSVRRTASATPTYEGTLRAGDSKTFSGASFHIRFGGAANVRAVLNGKPLALPGGTYSVTIGPSGLGPRSA
jgi:cytoskeleton protein RodZ